MVVCVCVVNSERFECRTDEVSAAVTFRPEPKKRTANHRLAVKAKTMASNGFGYGDYNTKETE